MSTLWEILQKRLPHITERVEREMADRQEAETRARLGDELVDRLYPVLERAIVYARQGYTFGMAVDEAAYQLGVEVSPMERGKLALVTARALVRLDKAGL